MLYARRFAVGMSRQGHPPFCLKLAVNPPHECAIQRPHGRTEEAQTLNVQYRTLAVAVKFQARHSLPRINQTGSLPHQHAVQQPYGRTEEAQALEVQYRMLADAVKFPGQASPSLHPLSQMHAASTRSPAAVRPH